MLSLSLTPKQQVIASKFLCKNFHAERLACLLHLLLFLPTWTRSTGHVQKLWPTALPMITAATALFRSSSTTASLISRPSRRRWFERAAGRHPSFLAPHGGAIVSGILGIYGQRGSLLPWGWPRWTTSLLCRVVVGGLAGRCHRFSSSPEFVDIPVVQRRVRIQCG